MAWQQISLRCDSRDSERLDQLLMECGALSVTLSDAEEHPVFEPPPGEVRLWPNVVMVAMLPEDHDVAFLVQEIQQAEDIAVQYLGCEVLEDKDWVTASRDTFKPIRCGERLWICPGWQSPPVADAVNLMLDPGLAFGTGSHPTTAMCLEWLDGAELGSLRIMDFGCGSGILAIAALLLGAEHVIAVDNDPQALTACQGNAEQNHCAENIGICGVDDYPDEKVDVLLANILAGPLVELAREFAGLLKSGGYLVLSGILQDQQKMIEVAYSPWFDITGVENRDGWLRLEAQRTVAGVD